MGNIQGFWSIVDGMSMGPLQGRPLALTSNWTEADGIETYGTEVDGAAEKKSLNVPHLGVFQSQSFLILSNQNWQEFHHCQGCRPFKIFGWDPKKQAFTLPLFDAALTDLEHYIELSDDGNQLLLYQIHPDRMFCYVYQPCASEGSSLHPTQYQLQAFACHDHQKWELLIEGDYH